MSEQIKMERNADRHAKAILDRIKNIDYSALRDTYESGYIAGQESKMGLPFFVGIMFGIILSLFGLIIFAVNHNGVIKLY